MGKIGSTAESDRNCLVLVWRRLAFTGDDGREGDLLPMSSLFFAQTRVLTSASRLFAFHSNPHNIHHVMPPSLKVVELKTEVPARQGGLIEIRARDWGVIPMHWICRWQVVEEPMRLIDEMLQGPFERFVHEHRFEDVEDGVCLMTDRVEYQWGRSWWGKAVSETFIRGYLVALFWYRHRRTRAWARRQGD